MDNRKRGHEITKHAASLAQQTKIRRTLHVYFFLRHDRLCDKRQSRRPIVLRPPGNLPKGRNWLLKQLASDINPSRTPSYHVQSLDRAPSLDTSQTSGLDRRHLAISNFISATNIPDAFHPKFHRLNLKRRTLDLPPSALPSEWRHPREGSCLSQDMERSSDIIGRKADGDKYCQQAYTRSLASTDPAARRYRIFPIRRTSSRSRPAGQLGYRSPPGKP